MIKIKYDASGALSGLERAKGSLKNSLFTALIRSTALAREAVIENIKTGGKKNLGWPAFSSSTLSTKSKRGRSLIGLVDTGRMMTSIHERVSRTKLEGEIYPGVNYLMYHEKGTTKMPERQTFEPVPGQINKKIEGIFKSEIAKGLAF